MLRQCLFSYEWYAVICMRLWCCLLNDDNVTSQSLLTPAGMSPTLNLSHSREVLVEEVAMVALEEAAKAISAAAKEVKSFS